MRPFFAILFLFGTLAARAFQNETRSTLVEARVAADSDGETCTVTYVQDGDGFRADCRGEITKIRVSSIDTPELRQPYGFEAALAASKLLREGSRVTVPRIEHDRLVARVTLADGRDLGRELVRAGAAWHYVKYSRDPELGRIEAEAREAKRGLWAASDPENPAAYRQRITAAARERREAAKQRLVVQ